VSETTLVARRADTGERLTIGDVPLETLRALSDARLLRCLVCDTPLLLKAGSQRIQHFAHVSLSTCTAADHEPETDAHRAGKLMLYQHFRTGAVQATIEQHLPETNQRADVFMVYPGEIRFALEFQQANNTAQHWLERHTSYAGLGVVDLWFLGQVRYQESPSEPLRPISPYDPRPVPRSEFEAAAGAFRVREMERAILEAVDAARLPMLYYLDPDSGMLTALLARELRNYTLRAYRYRLLLADCALRDGWLWTPLTPLLSSYRR